MNEEGAAMRKVFEQQFTAMVVNVTVLVVLLALYAIDPALRG